MTKPMTPENQIPATMVDQIEITLAVGGLTPVQKATLEASKNHLVRQAKRIAELEAERERLRKIIADAVAVMDDTEEINPSNYDHELVCQLNAGFCEAYSILNTDTQTEARDG